jgi:tetratricopeptide (TPR) repeat protein
VAVAAAAGSALTIGVTALSGDGDEKAALRTGNPPLALDLGLRTDPEATVLRQAQRLYSEGDEAEAARLFARFSSAQAEIGEAFASWPDSTLARVERLGAEYPSSAVVLLHVGLARFWSGRTDQAFTAWRAAVRKQPDSASAVKAGDLLHPDSPIPGLPLYVPSFTWPKRLNGLSPPAQFRALRGAAKGSNVRAKLLYGVALQRLGRPLSAERQYAAAAAFAPENVEAQVAAAVGRYRKDSPQRAFSRLGPLVRRFPRAATVRFHLGLLLVWLGRLDAAKPYLEAARRLEPESVYAREGSRLLRGLEGKGGGG